MTPRHAYAPPACLTASETSTATAIVLLAALILIPGFLAWFVMWAGTVTVLCGVAVLAVVAR